jgi:hypothetical protein
MEAFEEFLEAYPIKKVKEISVFEAIIDHEFDGANPLRLME